MLIPRGSSCGMRWTHILLSFLKFTVSSRSRFADKDVLCDFCSGGSPEESDMGANFNRLAPQPVSSRISAHDRVT